MLLMTLEWLTEAMPKSSQSVWAKMFALTNGSEIGKGSGINVNAKRTAVPFAFQINASRSRLCPSRTSISRRIGTSNSFLLARVGSGRLGLWKRESTMRANNHRERGKRGNAQINRPSAHGLQPPRALLFPLVGPNQEEPRLGHLVPRFPFKPSWLPIMQHLCNFRIHPTDRGHALRGIRLVDLHPAPDLHNLVLVQLRQQPFPVLDWHLYDARDVCVDQRGTLLRAHR